MLFLLSPGRCLLVGAFVDRKWSCPEIVIDTFLELFLAYLAINTRRQEQLWVQHGSRVTVAN